MVWVWRTLSVCATGLTGARPFWSEAKNRALGSCGCQEWFGGLIYLDPYREGQGASTHVLRSGNSAKLEGSSLRSPSSCLRLKESSQNGLDIFAFWTFLKRPFHLDQDLPTAGYWTLTGGFHTFCQETPRLGGSISWATRSKSLQDPRFICSQLGNTCTRLRTQVQARRTEVFGEQASHDPMVLEAAGMAEKRPGLRVETPSQGPGPLLGCPFTSKRPSDSDGSGPLGIRCFEDQCR